MRLILKEPMTQLAPELQLSKGSWEQKVITC